MLPQELCAEYLWLEWFMYGYFNDCKIKEILKRYNMKLKKGKTISDIRLAFSRGLKDTYGNAKKQMENIAEEIDKVCIIARWDFAVDRYKGIKR